MRNQPRSLPRESRASPSRLRGGARRRARSRVLLAFTLLFILLTIQANGATGQGFASFVIRRAVQGEGFRFGEWEAQAIGQKLRDAAARPGAGLSEEEKRVLVTDYFAGVGRAASLKRRITQVYATEGDRAAATAAPLESELAALRVTQAGRRPAAERILEQQVGAVLSAEGLGTAVGIFPPVRFQFTESPNVLILSPRARISYDRAVHLNPALSVEMMERIEAEVEAALPAQSALVEGTGGFSSYPTMVLEYSVLEWVVDTVAHEWTHTYLTFRPLGISYLSGPQMRTINETVASLVGDEVSLKVVEHYYPERAAAAPWPRPLSMEPGWLDPDTEPTEFDFGAFMRRTRQETDRLLAEGRVPDAEAYMEQRRKELVDRGYAIRKLNQAYFAFHGSYAVGAFATDPIGAKLRALRARSPSLLAFLRVVSPMNDPSDLDAALGPAPRPAPSAAYAPSSALAMPVLSGSALTPRRERH